MRCKIEFMNHKQITTNALEQLISNTGLVASVTEYAPLLNQDDNDNALIQIDNPKAQLVAKLIKWAANTDSGAIIKKLNDMAGGHDKVLICDYVNEELGQRLREAHINYLDKVGNAYLNVSSIYVSIQGKVPAEKTISKKANQLFTEVGMKIAFALLTNHDLLNANYRQIANSANVSMGAIGWVLRELKEQSFIVESKGKIGWNDRPALLKQWCEEYPTLKKKTQLGSYYTQDTNWWKTVDLKRYDAVLGNEVAALTYQRGFKPKLGSIYVGKNKQGSLIRDLQLIKVDSVTAGLYPNIEIRSKFWSKELEETGDNNVTNPLLTHADLMDTWEPKSREVAEHVFKLYLAS